MTYKELKSDTRYLNININGNLKLKNNDKTRFIIWNLPAIETCPYSTELCRKSCYARKAERLYKDVLFSRKTNYKRSLQADFVENMIFTIETELNTKKFKGKKVVFRIHESGDFYSLEYAEKWVKIAKHFENNKNIVFLAYTKSIKYFTILDYNLPNFPTNLIIRSSLWSDTLPELAKLTKWYSFPIYTALTENEMETERQNGHVFAKCNCKDCATCGMCWNNKIKDIIVKIH